MRCSVGAREVRWRLTIILAGTAILAAGCGPDAGQATSPTAGPMAPGTPGDPREVVLVTRDWSYEPAVLGVVPGETVLLQVVNGGLETHEAIIGDDAVQAAWGAAEAAASPGPPGVLPSVNVDSAQAGLRVVVRSGERVDVVWTVPADPAAAEALLIGCHIADHWERGMRGDVTIANEAGGGS